VVSTTITSESVEVEGARGREVGSKACGSTSISSGGVPTMDGAVIVFREAPVAEEIEAMAVECEGSCCVGVPTGGEEGVVVVEGKRALMIAEGWWSQGRCFVGGLDDAMEVEGLIGGVLMVDACWVAVTMLDGSGEEKEKGRM